MEPRRIASDRGGNVAVGFALVSPILIALVGLGVDSASFNNQQSRMQSVADSAALAIAKELHLFLDNTAPLKASGEDRIKTLLAEVGLEERPRTSEISIDVESGAVEVEISMPMKPFLPVEVWGENPIVVSAVARTYGHVRLCVLGLQQDSSGTIRADNQSLVTAPDCAVQSNSTDPSGLRADNQSTIISGFTCTSGGYEGSESAFVPLPEIDCPTLPDPLEDRAPPAVSGCDFLDFVLAAGTHTIMPGTYCGGIKIVGDSNVTAESGIYIISGGKLEVGNEASLRGDYVSFYFHDDAATFVFKDRSEVELGAPKEGPMAGILFYEDRSAPPGRTFEITSGSVRKLLGTIYLPRGIFKAASSTEMLALSSTSSSRSDGNDDDDGDEEDKGGGGPNKSIGAASAYTVIVANKLELAGVNLVINADYGSSDVPVPSGVGPHSTKVLLSK